MKFYSESRITYCTFQYTGQILLRSYYPPGFYQLQMTETAYLTAQFF